MKVEHPEQPSPFEQARKTLLEAKLSSPEYRSAESLERIDMNTEQMNRQLQDLQDTVKTHATELNEIKQQAKRDRYINALQSLIIAVLAALIVHLLTKYVFV